MRSSSSALAVALIAGLAAGCGSPPRAPTISSRPTARVVEVDLLLDVGARLLAVRATWAAAGRALDSTDHDRTWDDLDPMQRDRYLAAADEVAELGRLLADDLTAAGLIDDATSMRAAVAPIDAYREGPPDDPPSDLAPAVDRLLAAVRAELVVQADPSEPRSSGACVIRRLAAAEAIADHLAFIDEAVVTSEMAVHETGLPPGSAEQEEVEADHANVLAELEDWRLWIERGSVGGLTELELAPVPAIATPPVPVPEPVEADWSRLSSALVSARAACVSTGSPPADLSVRLDP